MADDMLKRGPSTRAVHAGEEIDPTTGAVSVPIYQTAPFGFPTAQSLEDAFLRPKGEYIYSRMGNPTVRALEEKVAALEGAENALAAGSGMAAISTVMFTLLRPGSRLVAFRDLYGGSSGFFSRILEPWGVEVAWVDVGSELGDGAVLREALGAEADLLYLESPTNPTLKVVDIARAVGCAREAGAKVVVDSTFATPVLQRPLELGAEVVIHSLTKYLGGHGDTTGGVITGSADLIAETRTRLIDLGGIMDPMAAFLLLRGMKTIKVRVERACANALEIARFLEARPEVRQVNYPGLESSQFHETAGGQMAAFGGMLSFEVDGDLAAAHRVVDSLELIKIVPSLGSVETTLLLPAVSSHYKFSREEREAMGVPDGLIRLSVGIEEIEDIMADLETGLAAL